MGALDLIIPVNPARSSIPIPDAGEEAGGGSARGSWFFPCLTTAPHPIATLILSGAINERTMKPSHSYSLLFAGFFLILVLALLFMGCTQPAYQIPATPPATQVSPSQPPVATTVTATLPYGVTISVPADWKRQDTLTMGLTDYGRDAVNIAKFTSPAEVPGDPESFNSLSIDVDQNFQGPFDQYFNNATIALGKTYGTQMESHSITLKIAGYDSYELDFQTADVKGSYIFTNAKGAVYIFAWKGPDKPLAVNALQGEITDMYTSIGISPP